MNKVVDVSRFHTFNASRTCEGLSITPPGQGTTQEAEVFAKSQDHRTPRGWLVHLVNVYEFYNCFHLKHYFSFVHHVQLV